MSAVFMLTHSLLNNSTIEQTVWEQGFVLAAMTRKKQAPTLILLEIRPLGQVRIITGCTNLTLTFLVYQEDIEIVLNYLVDTNRRTIQKRCSLYAAPF
jgi:hypothetical protein